MIRDHRPRGFAAIGLINPKTDHNVGGVARAAYCYNAALLVIEGDRYKQTSTNTLKSERHMPVIEVTRLEDAIPYACEPVVVEITSNAIDLVNFIHPHAAFYIFGPEDGGVPTRFMGYRQIKITTRVCMNLAATVNIVLYDRMAKQIRAGRTLP